MPTDYQNILTDLVKRIRPLLVGVAEGTCRVIELAVGWKIYSGADPRFMEHGENTIFAEDDGDHTIGATSVENFVHGYGNTLSNGAVKNTLFGWNHNLDEVNFSLVFGRGVKVPAPDSNEFNGLLRHSQGYISSIGDNQVGTLCPNNSASFSGSGWTTFMEFDIPTDTIWLFRAFVLLTTQGCAQTQAFSIEGVIENDGGTTTMLAATTTNVHRDTTTIECQAIADDTADEMEIQLRDTGSNNYTCRFLFRIDTAELSYPA